MTLPSERRKPLETTDRSTADSLGDRIARLRRAKGWNQRELGRRTGMKATQISKYERGIYVPRADALPRLSAALGVSSDYLLTGRSFREPQHDLRLRERLEALEALPETQRDNLVGFLDALITAHQLLRRYQEQAEQRREQERGKRPGKGGRRSPPGSRRS
jgi:transcriptional regulator with XRE-family HTH domain